MPTVNLAVDDSTPVKVTSDSNQAYGIVSFLNSGTGHVYVYNANDANTPDATTVRASGVILEPENANQLQLQDGVNGYRLDWWWMVAASSESSAVGVAW